MTYLLPKIHSRDVAFVSTMVFTMVVIVAASNFLVEYPLDTFLVGYSWASWLTLGAFTYPFAFVCTDILTLRCGPAVARLAIAAGFVIAAIISFSLFDPRIAIASLLAFTSAQLIDIRIFMRFSAVRWYMRPLITTQIAALLDTFLFFSLAFAGSDVPWVQLAIGDYLVKSLMAIFGLFPYALLRSFFVIRIQNSLA